MAVQYPNSSDPENRLLAKLLQNGVGPNYYSSGDSTWMILRKLVANQATGIVGATTDSERNLIAKLLKNNAQEGGGGGPTPPAKTSYRFYRVQNNVNSPGAYLEVQRINLMDKDGAYIHAAMTGNTTPSPLVATASTAAFGSAPWMCWDRLTANRVHSDTPATNQWFQIDIGNTSHNPVQIIGLSFNSSTTRFMPQFTLYGSQTGLFAGEEVTLYDSPTWLNTTWRANDQIRYFDIDVDYGVMRA
jgi:hypothetical protein